MMMNEYSEYLWTRRNACGRRARFGCEPRPCEYYTANERNTHVTHPAASIQHMHLPINRGFVVLCIHIRPRNRGVLGGKLDECRWHKHAFVWLCGRRLVLHFFTATRPKFDEIDVNKKLTLARVMQDHKESTRAREFAENKEIRCCSESRFSFALRNVTFRICFESTNVVTFRTKKHL